MAKRSFVGFCLILTIMISSVVMAAQAPSQPDFPIATHTESVGNDVYTMITYRYAWNSQRRINVIKGIISVRSYCSNQNRYFKPTPTWVRIEDNGRYINVVSSGTVGTREKKVAGNAGVSAGAAGDFGAGGGYEYSRGGDSLAYSKSYKIFP